MKKFYVGILGLCVMGTSFAAETPLCSLPQVGSNTVVNNAAIEGDPDPGCAAMLSAAQKIAQQSHSTLNLNNKTAIPPQLMVGAVYLQPITMAPAGIMRPRNQSDIHLEIDIHAKENLPASGFAPGDWLPNAIVSYSIQKLQTNGSPLPINCSRDAGKISYTCPLMAMAASDGAHYGDNVKLAGPGLYIVSFNAKTDPMKFGWHTDTDSKLIHTDYVDWHFSQTYLMMWTGVGKRGGY